ncbi:protein FMC1 homolog isoform X3 [Pseudomyrmex gracilis]|uniref:protein FMC1 homolog isoform X3 n=1 Tax=Pseudomyrmex gracilis TaxID=219809 RepID=UPI000995CF88|nr:protein FMC1 homolog isoform X3 [Pseudomyrmex gracilis]
MNNNIKIVRSLVKQLRRISQNKSTKENVMLRYIMRQAHAHKETSQVLCKAREELKNLAEIYLCYLKSQQMCKEIHKQYAGKGERSIKETADLVGFKLPHDPK